MTQYDETMKRVTNLNNQIEAMEKINAERGRFEDKDTDMVSRAEAMKALEEDKAIERSVDAIRSTNEYAKSFAAAIAPE